MCIRDSLNESRAVLSRAETNFIEAQQNLENSRKSWIDSVAAIDRFQGNWREGSDVENLLAGIEPDLGSLGNVFIPTADPSLLTNEKTKFENLKTDISTWQTNFLKNKKTFKTKLEWDTEMTKLKGYQTAWEGIRKMCIRDSEKPMRRTPRMMP